MTERFSLVARVDGNKPVWGVALWLGRAAEDLRQSPARADGKIRQRLILQMKLLDRFILTARTVFLHEPERYPCRHSDLILLLSVSGGSF